MANTYVNDIIAAAKGEIATLLPTYTQLDYEYDLTQNNFTNRPLRFGFTPGSITFLEGRTLRHVTVEQEFEVILTTDFANQDDDTNQAIAVGVLYEASHDVIKSLTSTKLGLPSLVLLVTGDTMDEPEFLEDNTIAAIRTTISVTYKYAI